MNRVYKVIWSKAKHCYVVTSEIARSVTKSASSARSAGRKGAAVLAMAALLFTAGGVLGEAANVTDITVNDKGNVITVTKDVGDPTPITIDNVDNAKAAGYALKATGDGNGEVIHKIYARKTDAKDNLKVGDDGVISKVTGDDGTTSSAVNTLVLNKDGKNQITLSEDGIKVGKNSTTMDEKGIYAGSDYDYGTAKAALDATEGKIRGADGNFQVNADGKVTAKGGVDTDGGEILTRNGNINAGFGDISGKNISASGDLHADGDISGKAISGTSLNTQNGEINGGDIKSSGTIHAKGKITGNGLDAGSGAVEGNSLTLKGGDLDAGNGTITTKGNIKADGTITTKNLEVTDGFKTERITLGSKPDNYTEINTGNVTSEVNDTVSGVKYTAESIFNKDGSSITVRTNEGKVDSTGSSTVGSQRITQYLGNNAVPGGNNVTRRMVRNNDGTFSMEDKAVYDGKSSTVSQNAKEGIVSETNGGAGNKVTLTQGMNGTYKVETSGTSTEEISGQKVKNYNKGLDTNITGDETHDVSGAMTTTVEGQATENFKNGLDTNITGDETHDVSGAMTTTVEGQATENFKNGLDTNITGDETHDVSGAMTTTVEGQATENFKNGLDTNITGDETHDVSGAMTTTVEGQATENFKNGLDTNITGDETHDVSGAMTTTVEGQATENFKNGLDTNITGDETHDVSGAMTTTVEGQATENFKNGLDTNITGDETHDVSGAMTTTVEGQATENFKNGLDTNITGDETHDVSGAMTTTVEGQATENFKNGLNTNITGDENHTATGTIINTAQTVKTITGNNTVTSKTEGTTFVNTGANAALKKGNEQGSRTETRIFGNQVETGKVETDFADVNNNLTVGGSTTLGRDGNTNLTVNSKSEFKDTVKMDNTLEVDGESTFNDKVTITKGGLDVVKGGTTTDTLTVTGTSEFRGKADFKDNVSMGKGLAVAGETKTGTLHVEKDGYVGGNLNVDGNIETHDAVLSADSRQVVTGRQLYQTNERVDRLDNRIKKVGANAAALAALRPGDFNPDDKFSIAAGFGSYRNANAAALGLFYRPNENVLLSLGTSFGDGENMVNAGVSVKFGRGKSMAERRKEMADEVSSMRDEMRSQDERIAELEEMLKKQSELIEKLGKES